MSSYEVILFYKYVRIEDPQTMRERLFTQCARLGLTGRVIVAGEGINATLEGTVTALRSFCDTLTTDTRFSDVDIKTSESDGRAFPRLSVKVRDEIVTSLLPHEIDPAKKTGIYMTPEEFETMRKNGTAPVVIDMRNDYEYRRGHFIGSLPSGMNHFRELSEIPARFVYLKKTPVLSVCTGGVRCEKASAYLIANGFEKVYQLKGGMHRYLEQYPDGAFAGALYVFDRRHAWTPQKRI